MKSIYLVYVAIFIWTIIFYLISHFFGVHYYKTGIKITKKFTNSKYKLFFLIKK